VSGLHTVADPSVERHERAGQQHEVPGQVDAELGQQGHELLQHRRFDRSPGPHVLGDQPGDRPLEPVGRHRTGHVGDALDAVPEHADVASYQPGHDVDDRRLLDGVEPADGTEVDEAQRPVGEDEDVPRVGVGVEEPESQDLLERRTHEAVGQGPAIDRRRLEPVTGAEIYDEVSTGNELRSVPRQAAGGQSGRRIADDCAADA